MKKIENQWSRILGVFKSVFDIIIYVIKSNCSKEVFGKTKFLIYNDFIIWQNKATKFQLSRFILSS